MIPISAFTPTLSSSSPAHDTAHSSSGVPRFYRPRRSEPHSTAATTVNKRGEDSPALFSSHGKHSEHAWIPSSGHRGGRSREKRLVASVFSTGSNGFPSRLRSATSTPPTATALSQGIAPYPMHGTKGRSSFSAQQSARHSVSVLREPFLYTARVAHILRMTGEGEVESSEAVYQRGICPDATPSSPSASLVTYLHLTPTHLCCSTARPDEEAQPYLVDIQEMYAVSEIQQVGLYYPESSSRLSASESVRPSRWSSLSSPTAQLLKNRQRLSPRKKPTTTNGVRCDMDEQETAEWHSTAASTTAHRERIAEHALVWIQLIVSVACTPVMALSASAPLHTTHRRLVGFSKEVHAFHFIEALQSHPVFRGAFHLLYGSAPPSLPLPAAHGSAINAALPNPREGEDVDQEMAVRHRLHLQPQQPCTTGVKSTRRTSLDRFFEEKEEPRQSSPGLTCRLSQSQTPRSNSSSGVRANSFVPVRNVLSSDPNQGAFRALSTSHSLDGSPSKERRGTRNNETRNNGAEGAACDCHVRVRVTAPSLPAGVIIDFEPLRHHKEVLVQKSSPVVAFPSPSGSVICADGHEPDTRTQMFRTSLSTESTTIAQDLPLMTSAATQNQEKSTSTRRTIRSPSRIEAVLWQEEEREESSSDKLKAVNRAGDCRSREISPLIPLSPKQQSEKPLESPLDMDVMHHQRREESHAELVEPTAPRLTGPLKHLGRTALEELLLKESPEFLSPGRRAPSNVVKSDQVVLRPSRLRSASYSPPPHCSHSCVSEPPTPFKSPSSSSPIPHCPPLTASTSSIRWSTEKSGGRDALTTVQQQSQQQCHPLGPTQTRLQSCDSARRTMSSSTAFTGPTRTASASLHRVSVPNTTSAGDGNPSRELTSSDDGSSPPSATSMAWNTSLSTASSKLASCYPSPSSVRTTVPATATAPPSPPATCVHFDVSHGPSVFDSGAVDHHPAVSRHSPLIHGTASQPELRGFTLEERVAVFAQLEQQCSAVQALTEILQRRRPSAQQ